MEAKKKFEKGDFLKYDNKPGSFAIFEGVDLMPEYQYTKKFSVAAYFDPSKYCENENGVGWGTRPYLEVAKPNKPCEKTLDTLEEDFFWKVCTPIEKELALATLEEYGYAWDEENLAIIDQVTGKVVHKIIVPKLEYNGDVIKPISEEYKKQLKDYAISKNTYSCNNYGYRQGGYYQRDMYENEYWD